MQELKPCPFCGCENISGEERGKNDIWWCACMDCGAPSSWEQTQQEAIKAWNTRPIEDDLLQALENIASVTKGQLLNDPEYWGNKINAEANTAIAKAKGARDRDE